MTGWQSYLRLNLFDSNKYVGVLELYYITDVTQINNLYVLIKVVLIEVVV